MKKGTRILIPLVCLIIFVLSESFYSRIDLTSDQRYTLTQTTKDLLTKVNTPLKVKVLLGGELDGNFRVFKNEVGFLLDEMRNQNPALSYDFVAPTDPLVSAEIENKKLAPINLRTSTGTLAIYPYAQILQNNKQGVWFPLLTNEVGVNLETLATKSTEKLEFTFASKLEQWLSTVRKKIAFLVHHDELPEKNIRSLGRAIAQKYDIQPFLPPVLDSSFSLKPEDLDSLKKFDAVIVPKPTLPFSEMDKLVMDQYIMQGGRTLWMLENVDAEMDSIFRSDKILAFPRKLNLDDLLFAYGVRIMPLVIKDLEGGKIALADGETAGNVQYNYYTWPYFLRTLAMEPHPITASLGPVRMEFANPIELLENPNVNAKVLLNTSPYTSFKSALNRIELKEIETDPKEYTAGLIPTAVLLEGNFQSAYAARYERKEFPGFKSKTVNGKMIVVSDGDVGKNHVFLGNNLALGEDKFSLRPDNPNQKPLTYDNQNFILNSIDYLLGEDDFLFLRNRELNIAPLSPTRVAQNQSKIKFISIAFPLFVVGLLLLFTFWNRKRKYTKAP